ncbi:hypothetical protein NUH16_003228 [Penicillium rubens]|nr:hypothetical protein NUH16_003228 [Penicillium rubens]
MGKERRETGVFLVVPFVRPLKECGRREGRKDIRELTEEKDQLTRKSQELEDEARRLRQEIKAAAGTQDQTAWNDIHPVLQQTHVNLLSAAHGVWSTMESLENRHLASLLPGPGCSKGLGRTQLHRWGCSAPARCQANLYRSQQMCRRESHSRFSEINLSCLPEKRKPHGVLLIHHVQYDDIQQLV